MTFIKEIKLLDFKRQILFIINRKSNSYSQTILVPKTNFPPKVKDRVKFELSLQQSSSFQNIYAWQESRSCLKEFVLHDGPPYANGDVHVGHAVNKILKDITNRYKILQGYKVNYIPGWDCHGLPIELKVASEHSKELSVLEMRKLCRDFAEKAIKHQKKAFLRWGILGDWEKSYSTFDSNYESSELQIFSTLYEKGFIFRDYKPVYWSPSSKTTLAESELEYDTEFVSNSVYISFPINNLPLPLLAKIPIYALFWTTTPWTLIANQAICYAPNQDYCIVECHKSKRCYVFAADLINKMESVLESSLSIKSIFPGFVLEKASYNHPLISNKNFPFLPGFHVSTNKGTGLVHTAPAHGFDDYVIGLKNNLSLICLIDENGKYNSQTGEQFKGKEVLKEGNDIVIKLLKNYIVKEELYKHSYPLDWRTKMPVIIRASKQWFIDLHPVKNLALEICNEIKFYPDFRIKLFLQQLTQRPYWCISRQRIWGVPIPVFYNETNEPIINKNIIDHVSKLFKIFGSDCWWTLPINELLPKHILKASGLSLDIKYQAGKDILDIWFDSGVSWNAVLNNKDQIADLYLEGVDQFGAWFQSSFLISLLVRGKSPFKQIQSHGFATDENGKKMSKSVGNVIDPLIICNGGKNLNKDPVFGADGLRWWVASHAISDSNIHISSNLLKSGEENMYKLRLIFKFLLGSLNEFHLYSNAVCYSELLPLDKFMLHKLKYFFEQITYNYDNLDYSNAVLNILHFMNGTISSIYITAVKDRLYCDEKYSISRRSCQTVIHHLLNYCNFAIAPILPYLSIEIFNYYQKIDGKDIFYQDWPKCDLQWHHPILSKVVNVALHIKEKLKKTNIFQKGSFQYDAILVVNKYLYQYLLLLQAEETSISSSLQELFGVSHMTLLNHPVKLQNEVVMTIQDKVTVEDSEPPIEHPYTLHLIHSKEKLCKRCRRFCVTSSEQLCVRCSSLMDILNKKSATVCE